MISQSMNITGNAPQVTFYVNEGAFTRNNEMDTDEGLKRGGSFASPGKKGMEMQICTSKDRCVEPLSTGIPIGRLMGRPKGNLPKADAAEFAYPMRKEKLELYGELDWVQLVDTHAEVTPGTYLAIDRTDPSKYVIEEDGATNIVALETRAQNETGNILVFRKGSGAPARATD